MIWLWLIPAVAAAIANVMPFGEYRGDRTASRRPLTPSATYRPPVDDGSRSVKP